MKKLVEDNLKLVYYVVSREFPDLLKDEDVIQVGNLGLVKAAQKFDYTRNGKFSTYAYSRIKYEIMHHLKRERKHNGVVSLSTPISAEDDDIVLEDTIPDPYDKIDEVVVKEKYGRLLGMLTEREFTILKLKEQGYKTQYIADYLGVSKQRVSWQMRNIYRKYEMLGGDK